MPLIQQEYPLSDESGPKSRMTKKATRIYVLGAGCSVCGGYPVASGVRQALKDFAGTLQPDKAPKLKNCVERTCELLAQHKVPTTDQLAQVLGRERSEEIEMSKKAMSAFFFSLEDPATKKALPNYTALFEELFEQGDDPDMAARLKATNRRVLTYNYDRLFERTFIEWVKQNMEQDSQQGENVVGWLNSGLQNPSKPEIKPDVFALIKLHGGIGQYYRDKNHGLNHIYPFKLTGKLPSEITDDHFFEIPNQTGNRQTIFYPIDKRPPKVRKTEAGRTEWSFIAYEDVIWNAAETLCETAEEFQIIGYSMQSIDWFWFKELFRTSKLCRKVIIRNHRECLGGLVDKMERLGHELGVPWKVEGRSENFFGLPQKQDSN